MNRKTKMLLVYHQIITKTSIHILSQTKRLLFSLITSITCITVLYGMQGTVTLPDSCASGCSGNNCTMVFSFGGTGDGTLGSLSGGNSTGGSGGAHIPTGIGFGQDRVLASAKKLHYIEQMRRLSVAVNLNNNYLRLNPYLLEQLAPLFPSRSQDDLKTAILVPNYKKGDVLGRTLKPASAQDPHGQTGMHLGYELSKELVYTYVLHAQAEHTLQTSRVLGEFLLSFAHNMRHALEGCGSGTYQSFATYAEFLVSLWNSPEMIGQLPQHLMNVLTDPTTTRETLKNMKEHFYYVAYNSAQIIAHGNAQEKGALFCGFGADILQALAFGQAVGAGQDALQNLSRLARGRNAHTLGQQIYERLRTLPSIAQDEFREQVAQRFASRANVPPGRIILPGEPAEAYAQLFERSLQDFRTVKGILEPTSPLVKIADALEHAAENRAGISGYVFELESAQNLRANGYTVEAVGQKYRAGTHAPREFDLTVARDGQKTLVECKVSLPSDPVIKQRYISKLVQQKMIATELGHRFEITVRTAVSEDWRALLREKNITFREIIIPGN